MSNDFYLRYYVGHKGKFGHEFLEFEFRPDGKLRYERILHLSKYSAALVAQALQFLGSVFSVAFRYANNSNYKNDTMIRKEAYSHQVIFTLIR